MHYETNNFINKYYRYKKIANEKEVNPLMEYLNKIKNPIIKYNTDLIKRKINKTIKVNRSRNK